MENIIEKVYQLFGQYSATRPLDICTDCCMSFENEALLARLPVREIPQELLMEYNDGASSDKTPVEEVKHFLPRYIELISNFSFPSHSAEISLKRLSPFDQNEWKAEEIELLDIFSISYFEKCLSIYPLPSGDTIDSILIMFWRSEFNLDKVLEFWRNHTSNTGLIHFKDLYFEGFNQLQPTKMTSTFANPELSLLISNWLNQENVKQAFMDKIESVFIDDDQRIDEIQMLELNILYEVLGRRDA